MSSNFIDLRKYNIRTEDDAMAFIELFVSKAPQLQNVLKDQRFKRISLQNRLDHALKNQPQAPTYSNPDASVLDRMTGQAGRNNTPVPKEQSRIEQMKAAQEAGQVATSPANPADAIPPASDLPPAPVAPGEIGQLNLPAVDAKAPDPSVQAAELPTAPEVPAGATLVSEDEVVAAAGSKSERPTDDGVQQEDTTEVATDEVSDEEKAVMAALEETSTPTSDDVESVGTRAARKTNNGKHIQKK